LKKEIHKFVVAKGFKFKVGEGRGGEGVRQALQPKARGLAPVNARVFETDVFKRSKCKGRMTNAVFIIQGR